MSHFYITLPSDGSKDAFPGNTAAHFKNEISYTNSLVGEWDVALYEIHYKRLWHVINPIDAEIVYEITPPSTPEESSTSRATVYLYLGYYPTIEEVVTSLNTIFNNLKSNQKLERVPQFEYNSRKRRVYIDLKLGESLHFKPKLAAMLGISTNPVYSGNESIKYHGVDLFNLDESIHTLYVYCDIIENMPVGSDEAPLLRIVGVKTKQGEIVRKTYDNPMYIPVRIKKFDTVEINIKSNTGESVPFQYSKSEVILHFRKQNSQT